MRVFLQKNLRGGLDPACETSELLARKLSPGEAVEVDWKSRNTRSVQWHKKYWKLCAMIFDNCEGVEIAGQWVEFKSKDVVHLCLKSLAGLYDAMVTLPDGTKAMLVKSIAFDAMTAEQWAQAWTQILDVVHQHILPTIEIREIEEELARVAA